MSFLAKYKDVKGVKKSTLCIGLDPASIFFKENDSIPRKYFEKGSETDGMKRFCLDTIKQTSEYACAYKINSQFVIPFSIEDLQELSDAISSKGCLSIFDLKLSDIGSSNESAIYWMKKAMLDAFTFSPFAGNLEETIRQAHEAKLGVITLTLMSNPSAKYFMRDGQVEGKRGYEWIAGEVARFGGDGVVVGATNNEREMIEIREIIGNEKIILIPGIGKQGGDLETVKAAGENILVNVGRDIIYADDPEGKAKEYFKLLRK
ncbi:MAG TPA: orotidine-5'-phosphate decarboxylase [Candidatus Norongarragalinales archaeon]|nr:orotidine-5'-phosphate decarboxylase [Candidatus Norongarragalinales archaeon]